MACPHHRINSGKKGTALEHSRYIERHGRYSRSHHDLVHTAFGNMPPWALDGPATFWAVADAHERSNGAAYREHVIALPNELTIEQLIALAERLVRELVGNKPYQYAIHAPKAELEDALNPHIHLMYSDRVPDGIDRPVNKTFARYNARSPALGGWRKDSGGRSPQELGEHVTATRMAIAGLQNEALARHGHAARVDHRSLRAQGGEQCPERHLGPARVRKLTPEERARISESRRSRSKLVG